ncbi:MAG: GWxTD domain-containing protein [Ignavibacteriales bacterium]|nr:GWxTD domain-containing protein [Ignavibacteriales bacterium]
MKLIILIMILIPNVLVSQAYYNKTEIDTTLLKISQLEKSLREDKRAKTYFELAKLYWTKDSYELRNRAYEYSGLAVEMDEKNIDYKYFYADLCLSFSRFKSLDIWKEILEIDSTQIPALLNLAEFSAREFAEWDKSYRHLGATLAPLQKWADEDFYEAVKYYEKALKIDSANYDLCLKVALFYEKNSKPQLSIRHLERMVKFNMADKDIYLCLGLVYYHTDNFQKSFENYSKALSFMSKYEYEDYTYNSVKMILSNEFEKIGLKTETEIKEYISYYWNEKDPLRMTKYNERLLEHYSRVAYANLNFSEPIRNLLGWKTDRGEMVVRYGEPIRRMRIRPQSGGNGIFALNGRIINTLAAKHEIWQYSGFSVAFENDFASRKYKLSDSDYSYVSSLKDNNPALYSPKFNGPIFELKHKVYQFASKNKTKVDVYLTYEIDLSDTLSRPKSFSEGYDVSFSLYDDSFNEKIKYNNTVTDILQVENHLINTCVIKTIPTAGNATFEILRKQDRGVASYHGRFRNKNFQTTELMMSDLVLSKEIKIEEQVPGGFWRNEYSILPNVNNTFSSNSPLFLYYEIYNLGLSSNKESDFEQTITIKPKEEPDFFDSILSTFGLKQSEKKLSLTSQYKLPKADQQMYLQLDMNNYPSGSYILTVSIKDKNTNKTVSLNSELTWQ